MEALCEDVIGDSIRYLSIKLSEISAFRRYYEIFLLMLYYCNEEMIISSIALQLRGLLLSELTSNALDLLLYVTPYISHRGNLKTLSRGQTDRLTQCTAN